MADHAVGVTCPNDGTLTACAGSYGDPVLTGQCAFCSRSVTAPNPHYREFVVPAGYKLVPIDETTPVDEEGAAVITPSSDFGEPPVITPPVIESPAPEEAPEEAPDPVTTCDILPTQQPTE